MNQVLHIARKDFRHYGPLIALALACIVFAPLATFFGWGAGRLGAIPSAFLVEVVKWPLILLLVLAAVQDDSPIDPRKFWLTRPIRPRAMLAAKLLLFTLAMVMPAAGGAALLALAVGAPLPVAVSIGLEVALVMEAAIIAAALLASLTKSVLQACAVLGCLLLGFTAVVNLLHYFFPGSPWMPAADPQTSTATKVLVGFGVFLLAALAVLVRLYGTRRLLAGSIGALLTVAGAIIAARHWPVQLVALENGNTPVAAAPAAGAAAPLADLDLAVAGDARLLGSFSRYDPSTHARQNHDYVAISVQSMTPAGGRLVEIKSAQSELHLADGSVRQFEPVHPGVGLGLRHSQAAVRAALGLPLLPPEPQLRPLPIRVFGLPPGDNPVPTDRPARLKTVLTLSHLEYSVEVRLPLRVGATVRQHGHIWRIDEVELQETGEVHVQARRLWADSLFLPAANSPPGGAVFSVGDIRAFALSNPRRQEFSLGYEGRAEPLGLGTSVRQELLRRPFRDRHGPDGKLTPGFDADWLADAELVVLQTRVVGETQQTLTVDNFTLVRE